MKVQEYSKRSQFFTGHVPLLLAEIMRSENWQSCLEMGCGDGSLVRALDEQGYLAGKSACAMDISRERMGLVREAGTAIMGLVGDVSATPVRDGSIDLIITSQVIEHVDDDGAMVSEMHRLLRKDGVAYISTIFKKWYGWYFYRCNGKWTMDPTHLREYSADDQLLDHFRRHGLEIIANEKVLRRIPLIDSVLRRLGASRRSYDNRLLRLLRKFTLPIPGYYIWGLVCKKRPDSPTKSPASGN